MVLWAAPTPHPSPAQHKVWSNILPRPIMTIIWQTQVYTTTCELSPMTPPLKNIKHLLCIRGNKHWGLIRLLFLLFHSRIKDENRLHNRRPSKWGRLLVTKETNCSGHLLTLSPMSPQTLSQTLLTVPHAWPTSVLTATNVAQALIPLSLLINFLRETLIWTELPSSVALIMLIPYLKNLPHYLKTQIP